MKSLVLGTSAFVVATFATQAVSHFVVNVDHYAQVEHLREEPVFAFGVLAMAVEGAIMAFLYSRMVWSRRMMINALRFAWLMGAFLASYIAFAEAAKYSVPSMASWIAVELTAAAVQFTFFGILLHLSFRRAPGIE